jgi:hypothetical protein
MIAKRIIDLVTLGERDPETAATHPPDHLATINFPDKRLHRRERIRLP